MHPEPLTCVFVFSLIVTGVCCAGIIAAYSRERAATRTLRDLRAPLSDMGHP